jgi:type IV secretion system protein VirB6
MWSLHQVFVTAFLNGPQAFASTILHAQSPLAAVDSIWNQGNQIAQLFWRDAGVLNGNIGLFIAAGATWVIVGLLVVYTAFLFAFAAVALSVLLAVGPIFLMFLFFDSTKRFFEAWIAQLANYALIIIIASLIAALILNSVNNMAAATIGFGSDLTVLEAMNFFVLTILGFLLMRQVMSMASGLASGVALATGGLVSGIIRRGLGTTGRVGRGMWDAATGSGTTRWDPISRKAGYWSARGVGAVGAVTGRRVQAGWRKIRPNSIGQG